MPATPNTILAALTAAFPACPAEVKEDGLVTIKLTPKSECVFGASFRVDGDSVVVRGWGGESRVKADDPARCVKSAQRMIAASNKQYGL